MRELATVAQEMEAQGKRLSKLLKVHKLDTMARGEFCELVAVVDRLMVNLTDFNALHFSPLLYRGCARRSKRPLLLLERRREGRRNGRPQNDGRRRALPLLRPRR